MTHRRPLLIDPCRWMLLGIATAAPKFAARITEEVGPEGFGFPVWPSRAVYDLLGSDRDPLAAVGVYFPHGTKPHEAIIASVAEYADVMRAQILADDLAKAARRVKGSSFVQAVRATLERMEQAEAARRSLRLPGDKSESA